MPKFFTLLGKHDSLRMFKDYEVGDDLILSLDHLKNIENYLTDTKEIIASNSLKVLTLRRKYVHEVWKSKQPKANAK